MRPRYRPSAFFIVCMQPDLLLTPLRPERRTRCSRLTGRPPSFFSLAPLLSPTPTNQSRVPGRARRLADQEDDRRQARQGVDADRPRCEEPPLLRRALRHLPTRPLALHSPAACATQPPCCGLQQHWPVASQRPLPPAPALTSCQLSASPCAEETRLTDKATPEELEYHWETNLKVGVCCVELCAIQSRASLACTARAREVSARAGRWGASRTLPRASLCGAGRFQLTARGLAVASLAQALLPGLDPLPGVERITAHLVRTSRPRVALSVTSHHMPPPMAPERSDKGAMVTLQISVMFCVRSQEAMGIPQAVATSSSRVGVRSPRAGTHDSDGAARAVPIMSWSSLPSAQSHARGVWMPQQAHDPRSRSRAVGSGIDTAMAKLQDALLTSVRALLASVRDQYDAKSKNHPKLFSRFSAVVTAEDVRLRTTHTAFMSRLRSLLFGEDFSFRSGSAR